MTGVASIDGQLCALEAARIPLSDRGFLYGDAVFEALRTYRGEADALELHLERLKRSCEILGIVPPLPSAQLAAEVREAIRAVSASGSAAAQSSERYVRLMITRGDSPEGLAPLGVVRARRIILVKPYAAPPAVLYQRGVRARSCVAPLSALAAGAKPSAYLSNLLALGSAQRAGADDALRLGAHGELLEGATSSLFVVQGGALFTPPLALGILPGITRDRVLAAAARLGLAVRERLLFIDDAYRADELFLTSSVRQVVGLVALDGRPVGSGLPGPVTRRVAAAYRAEVGLDPDPDAG
jgi:branched-chain amino acid aminotransferase